MTKSQFALLLTVLWVIAFNMAREDIVQALCMVMTLWFMISSTYYSIRGK